jgi:hypothetical protein
MYLNGIIGFQKEEGDLKDDKITQVSGNNETD